METERIKEILEVYRPGEDLELDPEVRQALELASKDPELSAYRRDSEDFDAAFGDTLKGVEVPESLYNSILLKAASSRPEATSSKTGNKIIQWLHPAAFAAAAAIVILLALSFTFLRNPGTEAARLAVNDGIMPTANALYASLNPSFKSRDGAEILNYLRGHGGAIPATMPKGFVWDKSFACDVIDLDGKQVSLICFRAEDSSNRLHLFTFLRSDFPEEAIHSAPMLYPAARGASAATWTDDEQIHVLYSDNGEENLRQVLDI